MANCLCCILLALAGGVLATAPLAAHAQQAPPSEAPTADQHLVEAISPGRIPLGAADNQNAATLLQNGNGNTARLDQQSLTGAGTNQAYVEQVGAANTLGLIQAGSGNTATTLQQGNGNQAALTQQGQNNTSALMQRGDNNRLTGTVVADRTELNLNQYGSNNQVSSEVRESQRSYTINQYGNNNSLKQVESTIQAAPGYTVEMRGSGINLTIEQGKVKP